MNAEFQKIARRDKKAFLSDECKEIEKNNRMGKTRALFKKIRDTKETFHVKMLSTPSWPKHLHHQPELQGHSQPAEMAFNSP